MAKRLMLFKIQFDSQEDYVEAESMADAIERWHRFCRVDDPAWDEPETPTPDGCQLVSAAPVIR